MTVRPLVPFRTIDAAFAPDRLARSLRSTGAVSVPLDVIRYDDHVDLCFDLPGVRGEDIELTVDKRELVLRASRNPELPEGATMMRSERQRGVVTRRLLLAETLDTERLHAEHADGVLRVTIPMLAIAQPRRIPIASGETDAPETSTIEVTDVAETTVGDVDDSSNGD